MGAASEFDCPARRPRIPTPPHKHPRKEQDPSEQPTALEQLAAWLCERYLSVDQAQLVVERVKDFYADASVVLHFPAAIGFTGSEETRAVYCHVIWPAAVPLAERRAYETQLRGWFDRDLAAPLASTISCALFFTDRVPRKRGDYDCYIGPTPSGYEALAQESLVIKRAVARVPELAQEIVELVGSYPEKSEADRREVVGRLRDLAARLRSA